MEIVNNTITNSYDDEQLVSETSLSSDSGTPNEDIVQNHLT